VTRLEPWRVAVLAAVVLGAVVYWFVLRSPNDGLAQVVHRDKPVFNVLLDESRVRRVTPQPGELLRLVAHKGPARATTTVRALRLPAYTGDVNGFLPIYADAHARELAAAIPAFAQTYDGKAPVHGAPGYRVSFTFGTPGRPGKGADVMLVPPESPAGVRDGVLLSLRIERPPGHLRARQRKVLQAMRVAFRSFEFGPERL
jgi:hypothetical protein